MKRTGVTPGGPLLSATKKQRLAALDSSLSARPQEPAPAEQAAARPASRPQAQPKLAAQAPGPSTSPAVASPGPHQELPKEFPYAALEPSIVQGPIGRIMQAGPGPSSLKQQAQQAAHHQPPLGRAQAQAQARQGAGGRAAPEQLRPLESLVAQLVGTNPAYGPSELRAVLASRAQDKSLLLDNPVAQLSAAGEAHRRRPQLQAASKLLPRAARAKLTELPAGGIQHAALLPLHQAWARYCRALLAPAAADAGRCAALLLQADLHGAEVTVVASSSHPSQVGVTGLVAKATAHTLQLVTPGDRLVRVPKAGSELELAAEPLGRVRLQGSRLVTPGPPGQRAKAR